MNGKADGAFLPIAAAAIAKSGVNAEWQALPQKRLLDQVRQDTPNYCAAGIYKTPELTTFANFSAPFYRDKKFVVAANKKDESAIRAHGGFFKLSSDSALKLGAVEGFSYGVELDQKIKTMATNIDMANVPADKIIAKLSAGRVDYMLGAPEEFVNNVKLAGLKENDFAQIEFDDMPPGTQRHFMCSKSVDAETIAKISAAIGSLNLNLM